MSIVCIAEKPSVASSIAKVLGARTKKDGYFEGNGYQVTWTFGHLCQLMPPECYTPVWKKWDLSILPMIPPKYYIELIPNIGIKKQFKVIKSLFAHATEIINCGDAGQEGELIQRWVMQLAGAKCPVKRLWISSLTEDAIRQGFKHLRLQSDYDSLYQAGLARAEGDWLLGMNATRLYTLRYGQPHQILSVGRVQTPTLAMIVARDREIEQFKPTPYWVLTTKYRDTLFTCTKARFDTEKKGFASLEMARRYPLIIKDVQQRRSTEQPPQLYDLTSLQMDCNRKFGFSADKTLSCIQHLYELKLTTYPRVDTKYLTDDIHAKCWCIIEGLADVCEAARPLVNRPLPKSPRVFDNSKVTDHHAIIPTGDTHSLSTITDQEHKVYDLIARRFCAVFYPDCIYANTTVLASAGMLTFKATGRTTLQQGWRACYPSGAHGDWNSCEEGEASTGLQCSCPLCALPIFKPGESGSHIPSLERKLTTPPKRYTDASILAAMESTGIGRPSSRAGILETLIRRGYIRRDKKSLISNPAGRHLIDVIRAPLLKSPELTAQWEQKLQAIEENRYSLDKFMQELQAQLVEITRNG